MGGKMKKEAITTHKAFVSKSPLAQAIKAGNMLFISGQVPVDSNTMKVVSEEFVTQARHVLESLEAIMRAAGSSLHAIVKTTVFLTDMSRFQEMNGIYKEYFSEDPPARTCIGVKELPRGSQIEIEAIAMLAEQSQKFYELNIGRVEAVETIIPAILSGLALISILILLAQGMAIIFGIMGAINLAHGD